MRHESVADYWMHIYTEKYSQNRNQGTPPLAPSGQGYILEIDKENKYMSQEALKGTFEENAYQEGVYVCGARITGAPKRTLKG